MAQTNWEADKMLDVYIYDYLLKRNLQASAQAFQAEGKVSSEPVAIDAPGGFLFEWWSVFWDIFIARTNEKHSDVAAAYIETQQLKAREQHQQQQQQLHLHQQQQQHQQQQLQLQLLRQQQQQQQPPRRDGNNMALNGGANVLGSDSLIRQSSANVMASKIYEECLKQPQKREIEEGTIKRFVENPGQMIDAGQSSLMKTPSTPGQPVGKMLHPATLQQPQVRNQPLSGVSQQENKSDVSGVLNQRSPATDPSLFGVSPVGQSKPNLLSPGVNSGVNSLPLKGWPLTGLDQLRPNMLPSKSFVQSPQQFHQMQMLNPQQQQQLLLQAQQAQGSLGSAGSPLLGDLDSRRFKMLLGRNSVLNKDGPAAIGDVMQGVGSPVQAASQIPRNNDELLMKLKLAQFQQQQQSVNQVQQQASQQMQGSQQPPPATQQQQQDKLVGVVGAIEASKGQSGRKRKQTASSSGPANSTGTGNTTGPSSAPSTPSTHTPGDVIPIGTALQHSSGTSKASMLYGPDGTGALASSSNQLAEMERFAEDGSLDDNVESFLSYEEADQREPLFSCSKRSPGHTMDTSKVDASKGFSFTEFRCLKASNSKVVACHFSSDGKLLASAGHDKKAVLWSMDTFKLKSTLEEHNFLVTDVRFSSNPMRLATSSFDKTVKVWDADNPSYSLRSFLGHRGSVMSLDFHPTNEDLLCSCDGENEIRYWSVNQGICTRTFQGGMSKVRFQPRLGRLLAAAAENVVSIFDVESETRVHTLQRHTKPVHSVCWDANGDYVASVSEDSVRVWALGPGAEGQCVHELSCNGNKFHSCVFHPMYPQILVIGCYQSLELWSIQENKSMTVPAHEGLIEALAQSPVAGMVASASHDKCVKLWK